VAGDEPRRAQDAHADRAADDDREPEAETEQATEMSAARASVCRHRATDHFPPPSQSQPSDDFAVTADGAFLSTSSAQPLFNFSDQQGSWEKDGSASAKAVVLDFSFNSSGVLINVGRVDISLHTVGQGCANIAGSASSRPARIRSIPRPTPGRRSRTPSRGAA
jgi:hypothetical protein